MLPFGVGYYMCLGPIGDANVASPAVFWPNYRHPKFWNPFFWHEIGPMTKWIENTNKWPAIDFKLLFFKKLKMFTGQFFLIIFWPKVVQPYFHLKTCYIVNNNKYILDKAVSRVQYNLIVINIHVRYTGYLYNVHCTVYSVHLFIHVHFKRYKCMIQWTKIIWLNNQGRLINSFSK